MKNCFIQNELLYFVVDMLIFLVFFFEECLIIDLEKEVY